MMVFQAEARRWGAQLLRRRLVWWLVVASGLVPLVGALLVAHFMGAPPLLTFAVWTAVVPVNPLLWIYAGLELGADDDPIEAGALKRAWPMSRPTVWLSQAFLTALLGVGGALFSIALLIIMVPAWHFGPLGGVLAHGLAAGWVLASTNLVMLAWGMAWRALLPGIWSGLTALALPLIGFVSSFVFGAVQSSGHYVRLALFSSLWATDPWGYLVEKGTDIWGFGPYSAVAHRLVLLLVVGMLIGVGLALRQQLGASRRLRAGLIGSVLVGGAFVLSLAISIARLSQPSSFPAASGALAQESLRQERVAVTVGIPAGIEASATVWPRRTGLNALWLNPHLEVLSIVVGKHRLSVHRSTSGWLYFPRTRRAVTVGYRGDPLQVAAGGGLPAVSSFANGAGDLLMGGGWYPLTGQEVAHPNRPPIARYGLEVKNLGSGTVLTNVSHGTIRRTRWRTSTGLEVVAGRLTPVALPGMTLWSGAAASSLWRTDRWSPDANIPTDSGLIVSAGRPSLHQEADLLDPRRPATVIAIPWANGTGVMEPVGSSWGFLMALGNPNPLEASSPRFAETGALGLLESMGKQYLQTGTAFNVAEFVGLWSQWSPAWLAMGQWTALPPYQRPAQAVVLTVENNWLYFPANIGAGAFSWGKFGTQHPPRWFKPFAAISPTRQPLVWHRFVSLIHRGRWPTRAQLRLFTLWAEKRP